MTVKLVGSTSGSVSLQAPASTTGGAHRVLTLPDADATLATTSDSFGKVLQVVSTTKTDQFTTTSTSAVDITGHSVSITPSSSSNKILVSFNCSAAMEDNGWRGGVILVRDSTKIFVGDAGGNRTQVSRYIQQISNSQELFSLSGQHLDTPSTTSAITYKMQAISLDSGRQFALNFGRDDATNNVSTRARTASSITVMEIAA